MHLSINTYFNYLDILVNAVRSYVALLAKANRNSQRVKLDYVYSMRKHFRTFTLPLTLITVLGACGEGNNGSGNVPPYSPPPSPVDPVSPTLSAREDPLLSQQWHLKNTGQGGGIPGEDINVAPVWAQQNEGAGSVVAVVDDLIDTNHEDLAANLYALPAELRSVSSVNRVSKPYRDNTSDYSHGTSVAGLIAAARNTVGGRGVAPQAQLISVPFLAQGMHAFNRAQAMLYAKDHVDISNNSWGLPDARAELLPTDILWEEAVNEGITQGRQGKGIIYVFAGGNGALDDLGRPTGERSTYDGINNHPGIINVGAVDARGVPATYSEPGANLLVAAPSGAAYSLLPQLYTTAPMNSYFGRYFNGGEWLFPHYRYDFSGTSGAAPIVSGVIALMLSANPELSWRDVRWILAATARPIAATVDNERGRAAVGQGVYSHHVGFGVVDTSAAVAMAQHFVSLPAAKTCTFEATPALTIPPTGGAYQTDITLPVHCALTKLESVSINVTIHGNAASGGDEPAGQLDIAVQSPSGNVSQLATPHQCYNAMFTQAYECIMPYANWRFTSVRHLGEHFAQGPWKLIVKNSGPHNAHLAKWSVTVLGH